MTIRRQLVLFSLLLANTCVIASDIPLFEGQRALKLIEQQIAFGPRTPDSESKSLTLEFLHNHLSGYTDRITQQTFEAEGLTGNNLWATFSGTGTGRVLLAAHWDSRLNADQDPEHSNRQRPVPGANDGASGVAVLLEVARLLSQKTPPVTVDIVLFDLEDMGHIDQHSFTLGSEQFVKQNPFYKPDSGVLVDMVCDRQLHIPKELYSKKYAGALQQTLWNIAKQQNASAFSDELGSYIQDDHLAFLGRGIPMVDLIHYPFPHYWHTTADTLDKCSAKSLQQVGNVVTTYIYNSGKKL